MVCNVAGISTLPIYPTLNRLQKDSWVKGARQPTSKPYYGRTCQEVRAKFRHTMLTESRSWRAIPPLSCTANAAVQPTANTNHALPYVQHDDTRLLQILCAAIHSHQPNHSRPQPIRPGPCVDVLQGSIPQAEVEKALPELSIGKATGRAGWPAELSRHACHQICLDLGRKIKMWNLASFLKACCAHCRLPECASCALVISLLKKGASHHPAS